MANWDTIKGQWQQFRGAVKQQWGKLTDDDLDIINGTREQLEGRLRERYGKAQDEVRREVDAFCDRCCTTTSSQ